MSANPYEFASALGKQQYDGRSKLTLKNLEANELVFGVVGPAGSGTSEVANALSLQASNLTCDTEVKLIKASSVIQE